MADYDDLIEELKENRFAHLLKPIRDLQDNFNIDLAHELEEYLDQLENAQFAFEGAKHGMVDFAEAALLIQGSTCVYSKKVEYLYNLVYQALEAVKGRKQRAALGPDGQPLEGDPSQPQPAAARGRAAAAARAAEEEEEGDLERFWDVEPLLKECSDLDLGPEDGLLPSSNNNVRPPAALLALEDQSQGAAASTSGKGDGDSGVYRLQQCVVHCSGALLLDARDGDLYDHLLRYIGSRPRQDKGLEQMLAAQQLDQPTQLMPLMPTQAHAPGPGPTAQQPAPADDRAAATDAHMNAEMDAGQPGYGDDDDGGGFAGGGDWPSDDEGATAGPPGDAPAEPVPMVTDADPAVADGAADSSCGLLLPEFAYCLAFLRPAHLAAEPERTSKMQQAAGCKTRGKRVATAPMAVFDAQDAAAAVAADVAAGAEPEEEPPGPAAAQPFTFDDDDDSGGYGGGGGASDLDDDLDPTAAGPSGVGATWHQPGEDGGLEGGGHGWQRALGHWPGGIPPMGHLGGPEDGMAVDGEEPSYEELCRAHMESMLQAAAAREVQSDLARRVSGWRNRIDPVLKAEESRSAFDIQDYGERILGRLSGLKITDAGEDGAEREAQEPAAAAAEPPCVSFSKVAINLEKYEVSRMFSAMLQLINNRNVAIHKADASNVPPGEVPDEPFELQLLSTDMYHKTMGDRLGAGAVVGTQQDEGLDGADEEDENRGTQAPRGKAGRGRGKAGGGGAKRAKKAALADANE
ncbi:hypothetical protein GPECTOR_20g485 [Gonium pectorale]|uniref:Condensin-2 complex subunit H2 n=1 Tax=Gonium pectorale TaxID=33097 RepID=A0A150GIJ0_GONPE|nr:hypothetical protein GPECTOR_20g485 [Gonium pectorale]|eukprot:KXZ49628.1 hypothetical protein GPECTOR_20g485 [Gonium pectorale]